jgi:uncharacterized protein (TIGR02117 family)
MKIFAGIFSLIFIYLLSAIVLALIPTNRDFKEPEEGITILIDSNGAHADLVLPVYTVGVDWKDFIDPLNYEGEPNQFQLIAFGWGDKGFYTKTPRWEDLRLSVAFKALFIPSESAMNVTYYSHFIETNDFTKKVRITEEQYLELVQFIKVSFQVDNDGKPIPVRAIKYSTNSTFFKAKGDYHLFNTSNNWTNKGLKKIGVRTAIWAPFDRSILYHF